MTTTEIKERPILFSGPMVRALLEGRKTQTRRVIKDVPTYPHLGRPIMDWPLSAVYQEDGRFWLDVQTDVDDNSHKELVCPYGQPGDRLWVRETWGTLEWMTVIGPPRLREEIVYRAGPHPFGQDVPHGWAAGKDKWRPSIHMPRSASRLTLDVTDVCVERLQEITEAQAKAEGAFATEIYGEGVTPGVLTSAPPRIDHIDNFRELWEKLNGPRGYGWNVNPWVWVVSFKVLNPKSC